MEWVLWIWLVGGPGPVAVGGYPDRVECVAEGRAWQAMSRFRTRERRFRCAIKGDEPWRR